MAASASAGKGQRLIGRNRPTLRSRSRARSIAVRAILAQARPSNYALADLIMGVCESVPLQRMRSEVP